MLDEKQVGLIQWLYGYAAIHLPLESDRDKLEEAIVRRFPEHVDEITKLVKNVDFNK